MTSTAILIANAHYARQDNLECCDEDLAAMAALIHSVGRFTDVRTVKDADADVIRNEIRDALASESPYDEIFFYFSGHGAQIGPEFFYCGTNFDANRPHETGLSHTELHDLFRAVEPDLLVKVIDACASGTLLVKADRQPLPLKKEGFRNVVQLASSLDDQSSFGGDPLSDFTRAFCEACLRKSDGPIYYGDVINTLRDDFLENDDQTPFFVSQGTGREMLVDDAAKLAPFREKFISRWGAQEQEDEDESGDGDSGSGDLVAGEPPTTKALLMAAEEKMGGPEQAKALIDALFDGVLARFGAGEFAEFFELQTTEHADFEEPTARDLIIKVLAREPRPDNFVTAEIRRVKKKPTPWESLTASLSTSMMMVNPDWTEEYDLQLNCRLERAQLRLTLTPEYRTLQQLVLVLSCAPSLERCYVFEVVTQHPRTDWNGFDAEGREIVRRWYKLDWDETVEPLVRKICVALEDAVRAHIANSIDRLKE